MSNPAITTTNSQANSSNYPHRSILTFTVIIVAMLEVLDTTIVNVSLPDMMGTFGANIEEITWVLTSYIVSSGVCMLFTGYFTKKLGNKKFLLLNIIGFCVSSMLCGLSYSFDQIIIFRVAQGIFGSSLVPLSQTILNQMYQAHERTKAMAIWGIGIMAAPVCGPTIGGIINNYLSWRWIFYINVPFCIISYVLAFQYMKNSNPNKNIKVNIASVVLVIIGIGALQIFLDRGNLKDWFSSASITIMACIALLGIIGFLVNDIKCKNPLINYQIFKNRNFLVSTLSVMLFCTTMYASFSFQPLLLQDYLDYPIITSSLVMMPRGLASAVAMLVVSKLIKIDKRYAIAFGIALYVLGTYMMCYISPVISMSWFIFAGTISGFGIGLFFTPISMYTTSTISKENLPDTTGLFSFARSLGGSIGLSIFSTILVRRTQFHWARLAENISSYGLNLKLWLSNHAIHLNDLSIAYIYKQLVIQSTFAGFIDSFFLSAIVTAITLPLVFVLEKIKKNK